MRKKKKRYEGVKEDIEVNGPSFKPKINSKNKLNRSVNDLFTWKKKREDKRVKREEELVSFLKGEKKQQDSTSPIRKHLYRFNKPKSPFKKEIKSVSERLYKYNDYYKKRRETQDTQWKKQ